MNKMIGDEKIMQHVTGHISLEYYRGRICHSRTMRIAIGMHYPRGAGSGYQVVACDPLEPRQEGIGIEFVGSEETNLLMLIRSYYQSF